MIAAAARHGDGGSGGGGAAPTVLTAVCAGVLQITLNRPERLNAITPQLADELLAAVETAGGDEAVRVVVLTGAGRGFCAGGDLQEGAGGGSFGVAPLERDVRVLRTAMRAVQLLVEMPKPVIAAVNGPCAGAGLGLACAADVRVASSTAVFATAFVAAGLPGDYGGTWTLSRIVGPARARELYLLGERIDAAEARRIGLVSRVTEPDDLAGAVGEVAAKLVAGPPLALAAMKANLNDALTLSLSELLDREAARHARCARSRDAAEAAQAFRERRAPTFAGR